MHNIDQPVKDNRIKVSIATEKDFDVSYFCGSGAGGQARNKVASGVQIIHRETGAIGRAGDSRSQADNKKSAFKRLLETPKMKFWIAREVYRVKQGETLEQTIENDTQPNNAQKSQEESQLEREIRQQMNPNWKAQLQMHYQILGVRGPQKKFVWDMVKSRRRKQRHHK